MNIHEGQTILHTEGVSALYRERMASKEVASVENSLRLNILYKLVDRNYFMLQKAIEDFTNPQRFLEFHTNQQKVWGLAFRENIVLLIFNYLAAVKTLADHTRNLYREHGSTLMPDYERRKDELAKDELIRFMHDLRDYFVHYRPPELNTNYIFNPDGLIIQVQLIPKKLLEGYAWKASARSFLQKQNQPLNVKDIFTEYQAKIEGFHTWFQEEQRRILAREWTVFGDFNSRLKTECAERCLKVVEELAESAEAFTFLHYESVLASATPHHFWASIIEHQSAENRLQATIDALIELGCDETRIRNAYCEIEKKLRYVQRLQGNQQPEPSAQETV